MSDLKDLDIEKMMNKLAAMTPEQLETHTQELERKAVIRAIELSAGIKAIKAQEGTEGLARIAARLGTTELRVHTSLRVWDEFCRLHDELGDSDKAITAVGKSQAYRHLQDIQATEGAA